MIRIVDILKKAQTNSGQEKPEEGQPEKKQPATEKAVLLPAAKGPKELPADEGPGRLFAQLFGSLELVLAGRSLTGEILAQGEKLFAAVDRLVELQMSHDPGLPTALEGQKADADFLHAARMMLHAVRIGLDANYSKDRLKELALVALASGIELGEWGKLGNVKLLTEVLGLQAKMDSPTYKNIINLAEIYDHSVE